MNPNENPSRTTWKLADGQNRKARRAARNALDYVDAPALIKGRDAGRRMTQEQRISTLRQHARRSLRTPDDKPPTPAVIAVMASLGRRPYVHTRSDALSDYRKQLHITLANSGFDALWMHEKSLRLVRTVERGVAAWRAAA